MGEHSGPKDFGQDKPSQDGQKPKPESGKHKRGRREVTSPDAHTDAAELAASVARQVPGLDPVWRQAIADVPRHVFLPDRIWVDDTAVDKVGDPGTWWKAAYDDEPVTTAVDRSPGRETWGTSSASQPSVVARMLRFLDPREGGPFLEIGAGTGWNAALSSRTRRGPTSPVPRSIRTAPSRLAVRAPRSA
ncbi:hypothetical protein ACU686_39475 [Yinghuangia aomiensis]